MEDTAVTPTDNKRYTKVDEYEALLDEKENGIEYEERLMGNQVWKQPFEN